MLLDLLGPMVRPPAAPSISTLVIFRFGATMELGRSGRPMMMPRRFGAARATGSTPPTPLIESRVDWVRAHYGFGGALLLDLLGPMVRPPAAPSISTLVIFRFGATMELGRSGRPMMMPRRFGAARATGSTPPTLLIESRVDWFCGVLSLSDFRLARSPSLSLGVGGPRNRPGAWGGAGADGVPDRRRRRR